MKLNIAYLYQENLDLYGDNGNIEVLKYRAEKRGILVNILKIGIKTKVTPTTFKNINFVFMGGGPDSGQKDIYNDLLENKAPYLKEYVEKGGAGLFICGAYQLFGNYYKTADGAVLEGAHIFDLYTEQPGDNLPRCVGNAVAKLSRTITEDPYFISNNYIGDFIVGFENHGGRTFLGDRLIPLAEVARGHGNNSQDGHEGLHYNNTIGTYFHGPVLARNPHLADYLIAKSLGIEVLSKLDDYLITSAHGTALKIQN